VWLIHGNVIGWLSIVFIANFFGCPSFGITLNLAYIMSLVNFELFKSPNLTIDHLEVGKLNKNFHLRATK
jgi:hypothetical protein